MSRRPKSNKARTGTLRIGNQWNAINIIARSQTHPLKAVCELTENAIDAGSNHLQIVRRRSKGETYLEFVDDGCGILPNDEGEPDFGRIATHVCDSMKRHLESDERLGVHGEFGIGLLSFWSLGDALRMYSAGPSGRLYEMLLERGKRNYSVRPARGALATGGTRVVVGPLLEATKKVVTGEKLVRYLSTELRDRIRSTGVRIQVVDRVSRKHLVVEPREFEGERVDLPEFIPTEFGDVRVEIYFCDNNAEASIAIGKDGTRVLRSIVELVQCQYAPWTDDNLQGILDYPAFELAPGTRGGIVPDEKLSAFIAAIRSLEPTLTEALHRRAQAETDRASRDILKQVHRAFRNALRELPSNEYIFFDIPEPKHSLSASGRRVSHSEQAKRSGVPLGKTPDSASTREEHPSQPPDHPFLPLEPGPLSSVRIRPRHARRPVGQTCRLTAVAKDENGLELEGVKFAWNVEEGTATLTFEENEASVRADAVGQVEVRVRATKDEATATDQVTVKILEDMEGHNDDDSAKGIPSYRLEPEHGKPWRSRYDSQQNEIIINSAHRDFVSSKTTVAKHRRYIGKLYAKEVVLINFPHESPSEVMERLIQVTLRTEDVL